MSISNTLITTSNADILTVPALTTYASVAILFCNYGAADETITVYAIPSGGSASNTTTIMKSFVLPSGNTYIFDTKLLLGAADKITVVGVVGGLVSATVTYLAI
jgi:hypothetical protein